ncbi:uncharacterized protein LOC143127237 [Alosa pseudoharengus]|uniref:uncharacterized protein LOC143127237 n=1 Tax=Alosa pseudoharengus TaxID=34774 RepID=UPI003F8B9524
MGAYPSVNLPRSELASIKWFCLEIAYILGLLYYLSSVRREQDSRCTAAEDELYLRCTDDMACTNQSAVDFIEKARIHLVNNLKHQVFIAEKLKELGVFNFDNVTAVTSEKNPLTQTRNLLDFVTKKGEKASYVFLRILDGEKNKTLPKDVKPDLHQWISCFPFKEESDLLLTGPRSCQQYQEQLKTKALEILNTHMEQINFVLGSNDVKTFFYTPLVLDRQGQSYAVSTKIKQKTKKYKKSRTKKLSAYIPKSRPQLFPNDLLKSNEQNILLVGKPGIGKTTVALEMINLWVNKENQKLNYLFFFGETTLSGMSRSMDLDSLLFDAYVKPSLNREEVLEDIKENSERIIIIVDGIKGVLMNSVLRMIYRELPEAKVVVTCRLDCEDVLSIKKSCRVCVEGFNEESIQTYLSEMLRDKPEAASFIMGNSELHSLCHVPVHALLVAACMLFPRAVTSNPCTATEIYLNIFRHLMSKCEEGPTLRQLNKFIQDNKKKVLDLSEDAFNAIKQRSILLEDCEDISHEYNFLNQLVLRDGPTSVKTYGTFLHNTMQEFFAAMWLLANPGDIDVFLRQCKTEGKHMRHVIPFLSGLLSEKKLSLVSCLCSKDHIKETSTRFTEQVLNTFIHPEADQCLEDEDAIEDHTEELLFLCQCLFELQSSEACSLFLSRVNHYLDLANGCLNPHQYCTLSYIIKEATHKKVVLNLENCIESKQGLKLILDCCEHVRMDSCFLRQMWTAALNYGNTEVFHDLLKLSGAEIHLPAWDPSVFERAGEVIRQNPQQMSLVLHCHQEAQSLSKDLCSVILSGLPHITSISLTPPQDEAVCCEEWQKTLRSLQLELCLQAFLLDRDSMSTDIMALLRHFKIYDESDFLADLFCHVKVRHGESETGKILLSSLQTLYMSAPAVWSIDLSHRKASLLLEVLKLQPWRKPVELRGWTDEESEGRTFLQCLPYISQLRFKPVLNKGPEDWMKKVRSFHLDLCVQAGLCEEEFPFPVVQTLLNLLDITDESNFMFDLYAHVKGIECETQGKVLKALHSVYQSVPERWSIDLSERKVSHFQEILEFQTEKKPVELTGWSDEESEMRSFLQCLPYISQLSCNPPRKQMQSYEEWIQRVRAFQMDLCLQGLLHEKECGHTGVQRLLSLCGLHNNADFLLDLYSYMKDCEKQTGRRLLSALQKVFLSVPTVWSIDLSEGKTSIFLEVMKLQTQKKPVELRRWSDEEIEERSFLQCLPFISQLKLKLHGPFEETEERYKTFRLDLCLKAALYCEDCSLSNVQTLLNLLHTLDDSEFLLDLISHVIDFESKTGCTLLPAFQSVYESGPGVWSIDLSKKKAFLLLQVLKLQTQKKPVELRGWSDEESEVRSFLQCLPYISQLNFTENVQKMGPEEVLRFLLDLSVAAAVSDSATGESFSELLCSVCTFPFEELDRCADYCSGSHHEFLLHLCARVKDIEIQTGRILLPGLQPFYRSSPAVWSIDLSKRKASLLLEVLKLQTQKKPVELRGWSDEESDVRNFLQCLPYISQLRFPPPQLKRTSLKKWEQRVKSFRLNLCLQASLCETDSLLTTVRSLLPLSIIFSESDFLLDLYYYVRNYESQIGRSLISALQPVYQSIPAVWSIHLSKTKASLLLEVLKLQTQKKPVELWGWSDEESEVRSFLQCLPYISQLRFTKVDLNNCPKDVFRFLLNLSVSAAVSDSATGESFSELLCSLCTLPFEEIDDAVAYYHNGSHHEFLLDLCARVKDIEIQTGRILLPGLQPFYRSSPAVWYIDLSKRKASLLLEVLKLQTQKKPVELRGWSDEESDVRNFIQCLPYISQLRFTKVDLNNCPKDVFRFLLNLSVSAAVSDSATGESFSELLCSVCTFPFEEIDRCGYYHNGSHHEFLLDLCARVKDIEIQSGRILLPGLQPFYQSAPKVWSIDLSERKASVLLEVLKLQTQKRPVELSGWSDGESEVRSFLQCLPYISQLRFSRYYFYESKAEVFQFLVNLSVAAAECDAATGERFSELLSSVCSYSTFPFEDDMECDEKTDFQLDLYSHIKACETNTHRSVYSVLQFVFQSAPEVWSIDLSKRKASVLLEVLKLQTQKKPVELSGWSDEESEVRSFLQCLPYISQLRFNRYYFYESQEEVFQVLVNLSVAAAVSDAATGESFSELLCSVCTFPFERIDELHNYENSSHEEFLLDLYSRVRDIEIQTGRILLPGLQPFYRSSPAVWYIDLSKRKASVLLEVLKLQTQKKPVELRGWSDEESEVRSFLQCLPYISQLRFNSYYFYESKAEVVQVLVNLSVAAAECDAATGERFSELLSSVCSYSTFPVESINEIRQTEFLLDLYSHIKGCETNTYRSVYSLLQSVFQSAPAVWYIDLSERKTSLLLEVLKLQTQKRPVELRGWSDEESEVRSFLQCLPYISQLSLHRNCDGKVFLLGCAAVWSTEELIHLVQLLDNIELKQDLFSRECRSLGRVLIVASKLDLTLTPQHISFRGVRLLFRGLTHLHKLRLNITMVMRLARAMRMGRGLAPVSVEELSLDLDSKEVSQRVLSRILSCLALLLRLWAVQCLDLTSCRVEGHSLIILLCQQDPLKLRLSKENTQQLFMLVSDTQEVEIIESFLNKVGGDLTSCTLTQEVLLHLLQHHSGPVTVDFRKSKITERNVRDFLHLLERIRFKRPSPGFIMGIIMEIYQSRSPQYVSSLLRSTENHINLTTRGLDAADCAALRFTLQHSQGVRLNLMWTSIPEGELESLLQLLTNVSQLSVDRQLLLRFLHCCYSSDVQQGAAAALLQALQHRLDLSCSSAMDLTEETQEPPLHLTPEDCRVVSMVIQRVSVDPELMLMDCDVEEAGLEHLFSVLERIRLRCSKGQLLQLLTLVCVGSERECVRRAVSLSHAVGGEVDLSHTVLDARACGSLVLFLEYSEGLSELDLSHCQLTDHCLEPLLPHLHKSQTLDLSKNSITDEGAQLIHNTVNAATSIQTVRLFNNKIRSRQLFQGDARFELW